jgi:hypothetical protein
MFHRTLLSLCLSSLVLPLVTSPVQAEQYSQNSDNGSALLVQLPIEGYGKPPEGCDPADPSTCRNEDRREDGNRDKPNRSDSR